MPEKGPIRIILVDDQAECAVSMEEKLTAAGFIVLSRLPTTTGLLYQIEQHQPDVVFIDLQYPGHDVLESLSVVNNYNPKPIVMFTEKDDTLYIEKAVDAGITTYLLEDLAPKHLKPIVDLTIAQFKHHQSLRKALEETQKKLAGQSIIQKAKNLLMEQHHISEDKAHKTLRTLSMNSNQSLPEAAKSVIKIFQKN